MTLILAGCGGGGASTALIAPHAVSALHATSGATVATTVTFRIPLAGTASSSTAGATRAPQYLAPQTAFIFADLQNNTNPAFDYTFLVTSAACSTAEGYESCSYAMNIPAANVTSQQWSFAAGAGKPDGTTGPPLSVDHNVTPCYPFPCSNSSGYINVYMNAVVADVYHAGLSWSGLDFPKSSPPFADFKLTAEDPFGNDVYGQYGANAPVDSDGFANPFTLSIADPSGQEMLADVVATDIYPILESPFATQTFSTLAGEHGGVVGIAIINNATASRTFAINYAIPEFDLQPSEFPQLASTWKSPAKTGTIMSVTCNPPTRPTPLDTDCQEVFPTPAPSP
jgi:hypothetical protein